MSGDQQNSLLFDTGATQHMFNNIKYFDKHNFSDKTDGLELQLAGGGLTLPIKGVGCAIIQGENNQPIKFENALFVPQLSKNLIAGCSILLQDNINIIKNGSSVELKSNDEIILKGKFLNNLMEFTATPKPILTSPQ